MAQLLIFNRTKNECQLLIGLCKDAVARYSEDRLECVECSDREGLVEFLEKEINCDCFMLELCDSQDILLAVEVRQSHGHASLLLVADSNISPMEYLNPQVRADSLLLRPIQKEQAKIVIRDFISDFYFHKSKQIHGKCLVLESRIGKQYVPFHKILYMEICEKKVYIRLKDMEYSQYSTLEQMEELLPTNFQRCHRSYICNMDYVEKIRLAENMLCLEDGVMVPLSRTYKSKIKEYYHGK